VRLRAPLLTALALGLVAAVPAAADTHYLAGSGSVQGVHFTGFVIAADGQPSRGWLSFGNGAHAVVTCTAITADAAVQGYVIDLGADAGSGLLSSTQYTDPAEGGGYIVYAGFLSKPVMTCPTPGAPPPPGFSPRGEWPGGGRGCAQQRQPATWPNRHRRCPPGGRRDRPRSALRGPSRTSTVTVRRP
jgi:hypothetical protein